MGEELKKIHKNLILNFLIVLWAVKNADHYALQWRGRQGRGKIQWKRRKKRRGQGGEKRDLHDPCNVHSLCLRQTDFSTTIYSGFISFFHEGQAATRQLQQERTYLVTLHGCWSRKAINLLPTTFNHPIHSTELQPHHSTARWQQFPCQSLLTGDSFHARFLVILAHVDRRQLWLRHDVWLMQKQHGLVQVDVVVILGRGWGCPQLGKI